MYVQTEILFPPRAIPHLRDACGPEWRKLVDHVATLEETDPESLAFTLTVIKLDGCLDCETDSFRAMRGCVLCAQQTLRRYRKNEREVLKLYKESLKEVQAFLQAKAGPARPSASRARTAVAVPA